MTGIQYITDDKGNKTGVLIDLKIHGAIWEDVMDAIDAEERSDEECIPYEEYRAKRKSRPPSDG